MTKLTSCPMTASGPKNGSLHRQMLLAFATLVLFAAGETAAHAQTFSVLYNFGSQAGDPLQQFYSGIISQGRDGKLYSGTSAGGTINDAGATYSVTTAGVMTTLYSFSNSTDGDAPYGGLSLGTDGNFYGTSYSGGFGGAPYGTVFKMTPSGAYTLLYTFTDGADGALPVAPPIQGTDGNFYGTTCEGCNGPIASGYGTIYKITPSGTFTLLNSCDGAYCADPNGPLVQGTDGSLYGTSEYGGIGYGNVFKITTGGKISALYNFTNSDGAYPIAGLVQGTDGNFYGTTVDGGSTGYGVVFRITPTGKLTVLHNMNGTTDGSAPFAGLVAATDGNLYGANAYGGANTAGTLFKVTTKGAFAKLYDFDVTTGQNPYSTLMQHTNGLIYGGTQLGGTGGADIYCNPGTCGVLYSLNIGAAPFAALESTSGRVGAKIGILGQNFSSSSVVTFGSVAATTVTRSGSTFLQATVPSGATTGSVTVTTTGATLTSSKTFRVTPQLKSFTPPSGVVGTSVTITGVSLTQTSKVTFGGVAATSFTVTNDTQVIATVPTGAKTGKIVITTPGGTATSATNFTVTP